MITLEIRKPYCSICKFEALSFEGLWTHNYWVHIKNRPHKDIAYAIFVASSSATMKEACLRLNIKYDTLRTLLYPYGKYKPNQGGKGLIKKEKVKLSDILQRKDITKAANLKIKLYRAGKKKEICEECGLPPLWKQKYLNLELHHIDGDKYNNSLDNLQVLCPNCHSQTKTFRNNKR